MHQYKGRLILHTGSMFSGKTSSLERDIKRFGIAGYACQIFKPAIDNRSGSGFISTHDNKKIEALQVRTMGDIVAYCQTHDLEVIGIDEVQFLEGQVQEVLQGIEDLLSQGLTLVMAGLDMDYEGLPFECVKEIMPRADYIEKHHAVCAACGSDAWVSYRKSQDSQRVVIGATETYEPLCRACYKKRLRDLGKEA
ncbi:MAG: thymidine kinase [Tissierellia bacterium]|nr:thymidine kinase [Tissierellia bacterium]